MNQRNLYLLLIGGIALHVLTISMMRLFPFIDLPMHLASATIFRYYHDPNTAFSQFFQLESPLFKTNTLHLLFTSLKIFPSVEFANKLFIVIGITLLPVSLYVLIKKLDGNPWFSLFGFLYLYNYSIHFGFVGYLMGVPLFLLFLAKQIDIITRSNWKDGVWILVLLMLMYLSHGLLTMLAVFWYLLSLLIFHFKSPKLLLKKIVWCIPVAVLFLFWFLQRTGSSGADKQGSVFLNIVYYYLHTYLPTFKHRLGMIYWDFDYLPSGKIIGMIVSGFLVGITLLSAWLSRKSFKKIVSYPNFRYIWSFFVMIFIIIMFVTSIKGFLLYSYLRFSVFLFLALIVICSLLFPKDRFQKVYLIFTLFILLHFFLMMNYFTEFQNENKSFNKDLTSDVENDKVLASAVYDCYFHGKPIYLHFPNYHIIWNKGVALTRIIDFPLPYLVKRKVDKSVMPYCNEWVGILGNNNGRFKNMPYILIRGRIPQKDVVDYKNFEIINFQEPWVLLKNTFNNGKILEDEVADGT